MANKVNAPVIILIVLILISFTLAAGGIYLFQKERARAMDLQVQLEELSAKQMITETKLRETERSASEAKLKLQGASEEIFSLKDDLQREMNAKQEALARIGQLQADLEKQNDARADLEKKLILAQDDTRKAQAELQALGSKKQELEAKIKELEPKAQSVELGNIVVTPESNLAKTQERQAEVSTPARTKEKKGLAVAKSKAAAGKKEEPAVKEGVVEGAGLAGAVLVVNKDYNFMVINLGGKDGVNLGDEFSVYHNSKYVGDVKIEKVHDSMAAAGFVSPDVKDKVIEGDKVVQKVK